MLCLSSITMCLKIYAAAAIFVPFGCLYLFAAEQKARATYEHLMNMTDNSELLEPLYFLREREVVHFQRFGECLEIVQNLQSVRGCNCNRCGGARTRTRR